MTPSMELLQAVRGAFVSQGSTLTMWCKQHQVQHSNARQALIGAWDGPAGRELRSRLLRASGLTRTDLVLPTPASNPATEIAELRRVFTAAGQRLRALKKTNSNPEVV